MSCNSRASGPPGRAPAGYAWDTRCRMTGRRFAPLPRSRWPAAAQLPAETPGKQTERGPGLESSPRQTLEGPHVLRDVVEGLPIAGENGYLRIAEGSRIIECAPLQDNQAGRGGRTRHQVRAAFSAELTRHGIAQIRTPVGLWLARGIAESLVRNSEAHIRAAARDV